MAKAGRKRKNGVKRQPNGQPSRAGSSAKIMNVALEQRRRMGLDGAKARDQRAESPVGRLALAGRISDPEWEAAECLRARRHAFIAELARPVRLADLASGVTDGHEMGGPRSGGAGCWSMVGERLRSEDLGRSEAAPSRGQHQARPETLAERRDRVLRQWAEAEADLLAAVGGSRGAFALVTSVVCDLREPEGEAAIAWLKHALGELARRRRIADPDAGAEKGEPGLRPMRLAVDGRETWRIPRRKIG